MPRCSVRAYTPFVLNENRSHVFAIDTGTLARRSDTCRTKYKLRTLQAHGVREATVSENHSGVSTDLIRGLLSKSIFCAWISDSQGAHPPVGILSRGLVVVTIALTNKQGPSFLGFHLAEFASTTYQDGGLPSLLRRSWCVFPHLFQVLSKHDVEGYTLSHWLFHGRNPVPRSIVGGIWAHFASRRGQR